MNLEIKTLFDVVLTMILPVLAGFVATKAKILSEDYPKKLSTFVLYTCQPFLLISLVWGTEYSSSKTAMGLTLFAVGFICHSIAALIAFFITLPYKDKGMGRILEHCITFGNCGFFGIPIIRAVFGESGVFYSGFFIITFNVVLWSYGNLVIGRARKEVRINLRKILLNAGTIPCFLGMALYLCRVPIYAPILKSMKTIGDACTPLSMIIVGALLARIPFKKLLSDINVYIASTVKLILTPITVALLLRLFGFSEYVCIFGALMMTLPSATSSVMFAQTYDMHPELSAHTVGISTILSVATIPLIMQLIKIIV